MTLDQPLRLCFFGFDEHEEGGRAWAIRTGLVENGVTVELCRTNVQGFIAKYRQLYRTWQGIPGHIDAVYVIFMGYYLMPLAWYLARRRGVPVILDVLVSQYDTEVNDRKRVARFSLWAWFLWITDYVACALADALVVDTHAHKQFFRETFHVREHKIIVIPVGCRSDLFVPLPHEESPAEFVVEFHGGISRLQGVEYILEAAKILQDKKVPVRFEITGVGQLSSEITALAKRLELASVTFLGRKSIQELPYTIARGDLCLGIFGTTPKALRVIPNKVYECMSCGKPVITERSPAALEVLHDGEEVCMVEPGNSIDLAEKIMTLRSDPALRTRLGEQARAFSLETFSPRAIVRNLVDWLTVHV